MGAVSRVRKQEPHTRRCEALATGALGYVVKPRLASDLLAAIREALATGALGYVVKPRLASDLLVAMREVREGRSFVSPSV